ncbi:MAG: hypothetical protein F2842_00690 [Actinobacteria bacterium]|nr:hypothetical protein [Actinomycetota bacterium]
MPVSLDANGARWYGAPAMILVETCGTLKKSALSVRTKYDGSSPTATPTPPWITPTLG